MPARIVLVHDDPEFSEPVLAKLRAAGYDVVAFSNSMAAIAVLEHPRLIELLITRVQVPGRDTQRCGSRAHGTPQASRHQGAVHVISRGPATHGRSRRIPGETDIYRRTAGNGRPDVGSARLEDWMPVGCQMSDTVPN